MFAGRNYWVGGGAKNRRQKKAGRKLRFERRGGLARGLSFEALELRAMLSGIPLTVPTIVASIDDSNATAFSLAGTWSTYTAGVNGSEHYATAGTGTTQATYAFAGLTPGQYEILGTSGAAAECREQHTASASTMAARRSAAAAPTNQLRPTGRWSRAGRSSDS